MKVSGFRVWGVPVKGCCRDLEGSVYEREMETLFWVVQFLCCAACRDGVNWRIKVD